MITVVTGPPCGGKSTYVSEHARSGDIIVDMDRIALALTTDDVEHHGYSPQVRQVARAVRGAAVYEAIKVSQLSLVNVWIIHTDPRSKARREYASVSARFVEVDPGKDVCLSRLDSRPRSNHALVKKVLHDYYERR
jgi:hypothetical protein